jgi:organic radical activating enzyme
MVDMIKYINENPNFTIIAPGPCNAKCSFCFWDSTPKDVPFNYPEILSRALLSLPKQFRFVSISGGEPTLSRYFYDIIAAIRSFRSRFDRVVLTTNGVELSKYIPVIDKVVDFVNISRHAVDDEANSSIFNTRRIPSASGLATQIEKLNEIGIPVTLSKVLNFAETKSSIINYIDFAKSIGASKVFLRKPNGTDLDSHPVEKHFDNIRATESGCPVCLDRHQIIRGMSCQWKRGILEPSDIGYHELVMQPSGIVTLDWAGKIPFQTWPTSLETNQPVSKAIGSCRATSDVLWGDSVISSGCFTRSRC